jgi:hypothetical protein
MMASIAKPLGFKWSHKAGLLNRDTNEPITKDPNKIAELLLGKGATANDLNTVETIHAKIKDRSDYDTLVADVKDSFAKMGKTLPESIKDPIGWYRALLNKIKI